MADSSLLDLLAARTGVIALAGAGGKKTTLYRLAALHPGRVAMTTTVRMAALPADLGAERVIGDPALLEERVPAATASRCVVYAHPPETKGRLGGVSPAQIPRLHERGGFEATYVKADGARMRWIKCPRAGEPVLPERVATLVPILSAKAFGRPLDERLAHRPELCAELPGLALGRPVEPEHVPELLWPYLACREDHPDLRVIPLINMVDDAALQDAARAAAEAVLERYPEVPRVVLARMRSPEPLVAVVSR